MNLYSKGCILYFNEFRAREMFKKSSIPRRFCVPRPLRCHDCENTHLGRVADQSDDPVFHEITFRSLESSFSIASSLPLARIPLGFLAFGFARAPKIRKISSPLSRSRSSVIIVPNRFLHVAWVARTCPSKDCLDPIGSIYLPTPAHVTFFFSPSDIANEFAWMKISLQLDHLPLASILAICTILFFHASLPRQYFFPSTRFATYDA